jgi:hypothetical protein
MAIATAGQRLDGLRNGSVFGLQLLEAGIGAVAWIEVQHHETGNDAGDDGDVGVRSTSEPLGDLHWVRMPVLIDLPGDEPVLAAGVDREDRPTQTTIVERGLHEDAAV